MPGKPCHRASRPRGGHRTTGDKLRAPQATVSFIRLLAAFFDPHCFTKSQFLQNLSQLRRGIACGVGLHLDRRPDAVQFLGQPRAGERGILEHHFED